MSQDVLSAKPSWIYLHYTSCVITAIINGALFPKYLLSPLTDREKIRLTIGAYKKMTKNVQTAQGSTVLYARYGITMKN